MALKEKVLRAALWVGITSVLSKVISILTTLVLARLLMPSDFGIIAIASLVTSAIGLFRELGLSRGLIVQKEDIGRSSNIVFFALTLWNILLYILAFFAVPFLSAFFKEPGLTNVIRIMTITLIISSFGEVQTALFEKEMAFKKVSVIEASNLILYGIVSVILAFLGFGYWSIIYASIIAEFARVSLIWSMSPWRPVLSFDLHAIKGVLKFGGSLTGIGIVNYLIRNIDDAFVARLLGLTPLGHYNFAYRIANIPATNITNVIGRIMFPAYSQISEYIYDLRNAFNKTFYWTSFVTIPLSLMIIVFIPDFFHLFYGNKWDEAVLPTRILAMFGLIRSLGSGMGGVFLAIKKPEIMLKISSIQLIFLIIFLYPVTIYGGIAGVSVLTTLCIFYSFIHNYTYLKEMLKHSPMDIIKPVSIFLSISIISIIIAITIVNNLLAVETGILPLSLKISLTSILYMAGILIFSPQLMQSLKEIFIRHF